MRISNTAEYLSHNLFQQQVSCFEFIVYNLFEYYIMC